MPNKNHLRIIADRQLEESGQVKFNYGFGENEDEVNIEPNYIFMARAFREDLRSYRSDLEVKAAAKDETIDVPFDVDYLEVDFMGQFHLEKYYSIWYNTFGLEGVSFTNFNRTALFSIADRDKFQVFISSVEGLINRGLDDNTEADFNKNVLFVKNFKLLTLSDVLQVSAENIGNVVVLKTIELPASPAIEKGILDALESYLTIHQISYEINRETHRLELYDATLDELIAIAQNFDVIESITSSLSGVVRPGVYNIPSRDFGFEFPAIYSRTDHIDLTAIYSVKKRNKNLFKPDVIEGGGDYGFYNPTTIDFMDNAAMSVLSSNPALGYTKEVGTSLAAPLTANLAAKLKIVYPDLKSQTLKALIINGASLKNIVYPDVNKPLLNRTSGYGLIDADKTIFSNENSATMILEDSIQSGEQKIYPVNFPDYLISTSLGKTNRVLKITATLCFSFLPLQHNQLTYCPVHMAFSIFKNHSSDDINRVQRVLNSKLRTTLSWSQSARDKSTPAPYSNVQKIEFNVDVAQLRSEGKTFKLAVQALLSNQIMASQIENYPTEFNFSLVLNIEETVRANTGRLYDELRAINNVEVINVAEAEADLEGEV